MKIPARTIRALSWLCIASALSTLVHAREPYASTYEVRGSAPLLFRDFQVYDGTGQILENTDVLVRDGRIMAVGVGLTADDAVELNGAGRWLSPGIIDVHSHLGNYPSPAIASTEDGNEATDPNTANVWAEHSVWPQDPQFALALAGGVTTLQILPGSANLFGGRGVVLKNVPAKTVQAMKYPGARQSLKMACGENPRRTYGEQKKSPATRMGNMAGYRLAWARAQHRLNSMKAAASARESGKEDAGDTPPPDLAMDTLIEVLDGNILVHNHCYRADEMANMIDLAREYGYQIAAFHHAVEAYKIADLLAAQDICVATWSDWWGFKLEAYDGIQQNIGLVHLAEGCVMVHSDSPTGIQRLNQEAAKAMTAANRAGLPIKPGEAFKWLTLNPARALGLEQQTGSIEAGKAADLVVWDRDPLSVYALAQQVYIDGYRYFDRDDAGRQPRSDFDLGQTVRGREAYPSAGGRSE